MTLKLLKELVSTLMILIHTQMKIGSLSTQKSIYIHKHPLQASRHRDTIQKMQ